MKRFIYILILVLLSFSVVAQKIQKETVQSVYLEMFKDNQSLGTASGFIIRSKTKPYLVTNWHVVTGKNAWDGKWMNPANPITPNQIKIYHNAKILGQHIAKFENLITSSGTPLYRTNKIKEEMVDVIELPLTDTSDVVLYSVEYNGEYSKKVLVQVTDRVFILGYPLGIASAPFFPIWKSGLIASEPYVDQQDKPIMWIDAITYPGMSGAPVYLISNQIITKDGSTNMMSGNVSIFTGVFSHMESHGVFGALWKAEYLSTIFDALP